MILVVTFPPASHVAPVGIPAAPVTVGGGLAAAVWAGRGAVPPAAVALVVLPVAAPRNTMTGTLQVCHHCHTSSTSKQCAELS